MGTGEQKEGFVRRLSRAIAAWPRALIARLPADPPPPSPDGLRGLREIRGDLAHGLRLKLLEIPGWFKRAAPASAGAPGLRRTASVAAGAMLVMFAWSFLLAWLDPFGLNRNAGEYSEYLNARVDAPRYNSRAQGDIVMVLINQETLDQRRRAWPPDYDYYADILDRVAGERPRAVYLDVMVGAARDLGAGSLDYAREAITEISREYGVPIIFGTETPGAQSPFSDGQYVSVAPLAWEGAGNDYPLILADDNIVPWSGTTGPASLTTHERESVALRLYRHACPGMLQPDGGSLPPGAVPPGNQQPLPGCNVAAGARTLPERPPPLVVEWGQQLPWAWRDAATVPDLSGTGWEPSACFATSPGPGPGWRLGRAARSLAASLWSGRDGDAVQIGRERCPYTLTVAEHHVEHLPEGFLSDRIVILALELPGLEDSVITPVHSRIAGGYLHAMALDNLMHRGADYRYRDDGKSLAVSILAIVVLCLALAVIVRATRHSRPAFRWLLLIAVTTLIGIATSLILKSLSLPAPNWVIAALLFSYTAWRVTGKMQSTTAQGA